MEIPWVYLGCTFGTPCGYLRDMLGIPWGYICNILEKNKEHLGDIHWAHILDILGTLLVHLSEISDTLGS